MSYATEVVYDEPFGDRPDVVLVGEAVSQFALARYVESTVADASRASPFPASGLDLSHLVEEPFDWRDRAITSAMHT